MAQKQPCFRRILELRGQGSGEAEVADGHDLFACVKKKGTPTAFVRHSFYVCPEPVLVNRPAVHAQSQFQKTGRPLN